MRVLGFFVKDPVPGQVKTRLAKCLTEEASAELYRAFLFDLHRQLASVSCDRRVMVYSPPSAERAFQRLAGNDFEVMPQSDGDLGRRMEAFFDEQFQAGALQVVVVGSDSPTLPVVMIADAFDLLESRDAVLGPTFDGGYYLIGLSCPIPELFRDIPWSTKQVFSRSVDIMRDRGRSLGLLPPWYDVDDIEDIQFLKTHLRGLTAAGEPHRAALTARAIENLNVEIANEQPTG